MVVVHEPELTVRDGTTRVAARVEIGGFGDHSIWFEADGEDGSFLTTRGDAFAAAPRSAARTSEPDSAR